MSKKNALYRLVIKLLKPLLGQRPGEGFLIVSTTGLGDTLWGTPAIRALRQAYPKAYIAVLTTCLGAEVFTGNPHLNEIFSFKSGKSIIWLILRLRRRGIGTVLMFHTSQRWQLVCCSLIGAQRLIGMENISKGLDELLTEKLPSLRVHEIEKRLEIVRKVGAPTEDKKMEVFPSSHDFIRAAQLLKGQLLIGLHPGAKERFRQWQPDYFIQVGKQLTTEHNCTIAVTGSHSEKDLVEKIASAIPGAVALWHEMPISVFAALIQRLSLFITGDTGPLHLACASKTPTIALFAPSEPELSGPYFAPHVKVIKKPPTCTPCLRKKCNDPFCLLQISPEEVLKESREILSRILNKDTSTRLGSGKDSNKKK